MPLGLKRYQQARDHHFITFSCDRRLPYLAAPAAKATVEQVLERTRARHNARIYAYVLMPEHVHLLINETFNVPLATFLKSFKQETSRQFKGFRDHFWQLPPTRSRVDRTQRPPGIADQQRPREYQRKTVSRLVVRDRKLDNTRQVHKRLAIYSRLVWGRIPILAIQEHHDRPQRQSRRRLRPRQ